MEIVYFLEATTLLLSILLLALAYSFYKHSELEIHGWNYFILIIIALLAIDIAFLYYYNWDLIASLRSFIKTGFLVIIIYTFMFKHNLVVNSKIRYKH